MKASEKCEINTNPETKTWSIFLLICTFSIYGIVDYFQLWNFNFYNMLHTVST